MTCYQNNPVNGTCNSGYQTNCSGFDHSYESYTTTNASCGGSNITCYKCCNKVDGKCGPSFYYTIAAAQGTGTCKYNYRSFTAYGQCWGADTTCYERLSGYSNATNGSCNSGWSTSYPSCSYGVDSYTTSNATCGGSNRTCYKCKPCPYKSCAADYGLQPYPSGCITKSVAKDNGCGGTMTCYQNNPVNGTCSQARGEYVYSSGALQAAREARASDVDAAVRSIHMGATTNISYNEGTGTVYSSNATCGGSEVVCHSGCFSYRISWVVSSNNTSGIVSVSNRKIYTGSKAFSCSASVNNPPISAACGSAAKTYTTGATSYGSDTFCSTGTYSSTPSFPALGGSISWTCNGVGGGSNATCTARRARNGSCASGEYTSASAAAGTGTCKYNYSSYTTTNAVFGGSNITCYRRLTTYSNPANGTCASGEYTSAGAAAGTAACKYNYSSYTTSNATCGGSNVTCYRRGTTYSNPTNGSCGSNYTSSSAAAGTGTCQYSYGSYTAYGSCGGSNTTCYQRTSGYSNSISCSSLTYYKYDSAAAAAGTDTCKWNTSASVNYCVGGVAKPCYQRLTTYANPTTGTCYDRRGEFVSTTEARNYCTNIAQEAMRWDIPAKAISSKTSVSVVSGAVTSSNATCGGTETSCNAGCFKYKISWIGNDNTSGVISKSGSCYFGSKAFSCNASDPVTPPINAACGTAAKTYTTGATSYGSDTFCAPGTYSSTPSFPTLGNSISWTCNGVGGGSNATCTARRARNGICGSANGQTFIPSATSFSGYSLCDVGSVSPATPAFPSAGGSSSWSCLGIYGGAAANCSAVRQAVGSCGGNATTFVHTAGGYSSTNNSAFCSVGSASPVAPTFPSAGNSSSWSCLGIYGGAAASCSSCRNLYPLQNQTACPASYSTTACANMGACYQTTVNYSLSCSNRTYGCYKAKTCVEVNGSGWTTSNPSPRPAITGSRDGNNAVCYHACAYNSQPTCANLALQNGKLGSYTTTACSGTNVVQLDRLTTYYSTVSNNTCQNQTLTCYKCATNAQCGSAAKIYEETATAYTGALCATGTAPVATPAFPSVGGTVTWTCRGINDGTDSNCTATRKLNGVCGSAHNYYFANTAAGYSPLVQCSKGASSNTAFPALGQTINYTCQGLNTGASPSCTTCRNRYPIRSLTACPAGYITTACANLNPAACLTRSVNYSLACKDYQYPCYQAQNCNQTNPLTSSPAYNAAGYWVEDGVVNATNLAVYGPGKIFTYAGNNYHLVNGLANGNNQICYARCTYPIKRSCGLFIDKKGNEPGSSADLPYSTSACANPASCWTQGVTYSAVASNSCSNHIVNNDLGFINNPTHYCYKPQTCNEANAKPNERYSHDTSDPKYVYQREAKDDGRARACYRKKRCSEIPSSIAAASSPNYTIAGSCLANQLMLSSPEGYLDGLTNAACVSCVEATAPWLQIVDGNLYVQQEINVSLPKDVDYRYLIRAKGACSGGASSKKSGIPATSGNVIITKDGFWTFRDQTQTGATGTLGAPVSVKTNFAYFRDRVQYDKLPECDLTKLQNTQTTGLDLVDGSTACRLLASKANLNNPIFNLASGQKQVIFVEGNLTIDGATTKFTIPNPTPTAQGAYLAFLVNGDITFGSNLGQDMSATLASTCDQTPTITGVFLADGKIRLPNTSVKNPYTNTSCDKRITLEGSYIALGGVELQRSFIGCMHNASVYPDYNAQTPAITFLYRPDLLIKTPSWMDRDIKVRLEVP